MPPLCCLRPLVPRDVLMVVLWWGRSEGEGFYSVQGGCVFPGIVGQDGVVSCRDVFFCAVLCGGSVGPPGPAWGCVGAGETGGFAVCIAGPDNVVVGGHGLAWMASLGRCCQGSGCVVCSAGSGGCPWGCPPLGPAPWSRALWGSLSLGVCRVAWGGVAWSPPRCWFTSHPVSLLSCRPRPWSRGRLPLPSGVCAPLSVWWPLQWKVAGVVAWQLGCGRGLCGARDGVLCGCTPLPLCGGWWLVGATRCGSCAVGSGLWWRVLVGVRLWGGPS